MKVNHVYSFIAGLLMIGVAAYACATRVPARAFDGAAWKQATAASNARLEMSAALLRGGRLNQLSKPEVIALLGAPEAQNYFAGYGVDLMYRLGQAPRFPVLGTIYLTIRFDAHGRVAEARTMRD